VFQVCLSSLTPSSRQRLRGCITAAEARPQLQAFEMGVCSVQAVTAAACVLALLSGTALAQATQQMQEQNGRLSKHANEPVQHKVGDTIPACTVAACSVSMALNVLTTVLFMDFSLHSDTHSGLYKPYGVQLWSYKGPSTKTNLHSPRLMIVTQDNVDFIGP